MAIKNSTHRRKNLIPNVQDIQKTLHKNLEFTATEQYKLLRANLAFTLPPKEGCAIIGVTSSIRGEGKSTTAVNLSYVLAEKGNVVNIREVVAVCVPDRPGGMAEVMQVIDASGANVEYSYAFAFHGGEKAVLVFRFADNALAEKALAGAGFATLNEREIGESVK